MAQYIEKSALVVELEKELNATKKYSTEYVNGKKYALKKILSFLDTLEVKDVDLVEEFADFLEKENAYVDDNNVISYYNGSSFNHTCDIYPIAKHFFELGLKAQKGE